MFVLELLFYFVFKLFEIRDKFDEFLRKFSQYIDKKVKKCYNSNRV